MTLKSASAIFAKNDAKESTPLLEEDAWRRAVPERKTGRGQEERDAEKVGAGGEFAVTNSPEQVAKEATTKKEEER